MSNKVHSQARRRIIWIVNQKAHNKVSAISRSRNKTDGSPLQMVGCVSYPCPLSPYFDLLVPCVTYCVFACFDYGIVRIQRARFESGLLATSPHSSRLLHSSHDLHRSSPPVGPLYLSHSAPIMSSAYSPPSLSASHESRNLDAASDANIRNFAPVARIMKTALPENAKIAKEAKECMQECVSEFISFITSEGKHFLVPCC